MSQIILTEQERSEALVHIGYTPREALFLSLVALHSGFFLRRQYCRFIGKEVGGTAAALLEKLCRKGHGTAVTGCHNAKVYHLSARPFYAALGQEDNRNRREREPTAIKSKLMTLDFVLDHPRERYLATERDKVDYFTNELEMDLANLPSKLFQAPNAETSTTRYFVDKFPIFIGEQSLHASPASFCFIDEGMGTGGRFESYLKQYRGLFARMAGFEVIYAAASEAPFPLAQKCFNAFLSKFNGAPAALNACDNERVLSHFNDRFLYETGQHQSFDRDKLIRYRNDRQQYAGPRFEALYAKWRSVGSSAVGETQSPKRSTVDVSRTRFSTHLLRHKYDVFGS